MKSGDSKVRKMIRNNFIKFVFGGWILVQAFEAVALTTMPKTWQNRILHAEYMGELECVTAGLRTAEFRVVDGWFGWKDGEGVRVAVGTIYDPWASGLPNQFLVGDRLVVIGNEIQSNDSETSFRMSPFNSMSSSPLVGRLRFPMTSIVAGDGAVGLPLSTIDQLSEEDRESLLERGLPYLPLGGWQSSHQNLASFKRFVLRFKRLNPKRQEFESLYSQLQMQRSHREPQSIPLPPRRVRWRKSLEELVDWILEKDELVQASTVLSYGGENVLNHLEELPTRPNTDDVESVIHWLRRTIFGVTESNERGSRPSLLTDEECRVLLSQHMDSHYNPNPLPSQENSSRNRLPKYDRAILQLIPSDPDFIVNYLMNWEDRVVEIPPGRRGNKYKREWGCALGTAVGLLCPSDREARFTRLLDAKDGMIRTAAAV